jgi:hypothetical protein
MITLKTTLGRLKNAKIIPTEHDAAVAHALLEAIAQHSVSRTLLPIAEEILEKKFGIRDNQNE